MNKVPLREATALDLQAIEFLTGSAYALHTEMLGAAPLPVTEDYAPRIANGQVWLLELDSDLAGLLVLELNGDHALIYSVAVKPEYQGKGLGVRLLEFAEERARGTGINEMRLYTNVRMERNIALYSSFGYKETGRRPNPDRLGWTVVDMVKHLPLEPA